MAKRKAEQDKIDEANRKEREKIEAERKKIENEKLKIQLAAEAKKKAEKEAEEKIVREAKEKAEREEAERLAFAFLYLQKTIDDIPLTREDEIANIRDTVRDMLIEIQTYILEVIEK